MRRLLPSRVEIAILATLAVIFAAIVIQFQPGRHDIGAAALVAPIFVFSAVMGLRRSPQWAKDADVNADPVDDA